MNSVSYAALSNGLNSVQFSSICMGFSKWILKKSGIVCGKTQETSHFRYAKCLRGKAEPSEIKNEVMLGDRSGKKLIDKSFIWITCLDQVER